MQKRLVLPLVLLSSTSLLVGCTSRPTDIPPPPYQGAQETMTQETGSQVPVIPAMATGAVETMSGATATGSTPSSETTFTRTEKVTYNSPAGVDEVEFTVSVENGVISGASSTTLATNPGSKMNQDNFGKAVGEKAIGKNIKDFDVDVIGGASLTTAAFEKFVQAL